MLKISEDKQTKRAVTLRIEGRVVGPWVGELRKACEPLLSDGSKLVLDLTDVSFVEESGLLLLASLQTRGVKLLNPTPFVEEQLKVTPNR